MFILTFMKLIFQLGRNEALHNIYLGEGENTTQLLNTIHYYLILVKKIYADYCVHHITMHSLMNFELYL